MVRSGRYFLQGASDDGNVYILRHDTSVPDGPWELAGFRQTR